MSRDYPRQSRVSNVPLGQEPFLQRLDDGKPPAAAIVLPTRMIPGPLLVLSISIQTSYHRIPGWLEPPWVHYASQS